MGRLSTLAGANPRAIEESSSIVRKVRCCHNDCRERHIDLQARVTTQYAGAKGICMNTHKLNEAWFPFALGGMLKRSGTSGQLPTRSPELSQDI